MNSITNIIELILHLDRHLNLLVQDYGSAIYFILFLIIFCETGLVITPFLPGDSLLFALGALAAVGVLKLELLLLLLWSATIIGDSTNFWIGYFTGTEILQKKLLRFIKKEYLDRTQLIYNKHGGKIITFARFMPIIRTFAPFVAGIGKMKYNRFLGYSFLGGTVWVGIFILGGYFFGNLSFVKQNFTIVIAAIILISFVPAAFEFIHQRARVRDVRKH